MKTVGDLPFRACFITLLVLMIGAGVCILSIMEWDRRTTEEARVWQQQAEATLARELGVQDIKAYPNPYIFPVNYFAVKLQDGMPITTVHEIVRGYVAVQHCPDNREVYDFYGTDLAARMRIQIQYDAQGHYLAKQSLRIEDRNSYPIDTTGCVPGRLGE